MTPAEAQGLLDSGRLAVRGLANLRALRERLVEGAGARPSVRGGGLSDPTARAAMELVDMEAEWSERESALLAEVDACRALIRGVCATFERASYGAEVAVVLEDRYLLDREWKEVAADVDRSVSYVMRVNRDACERVARLGVAAIREAAGRWTR